MQFWRGYKEMIERKGEKLLILACSDDNTAKLWASQQHDASETEAVSFPHES